MLKSKACSSWCFNPLLAATPPTISIDVDLRFGRVFAMIFLELLNSLSSLKVALYIYTFSKIWVLARVIPED